MLLSFHRTIWAGKRSTCSAGSIQFQTYQRGVRKSKYIFRIAGNLICIHLQIYNLNDLNVIYCARSLTFCYSLPHPVLQSNSLLFDKRFIIPVLLSPTTFLTHSFSNFVQPPPALFVALFLWLKVLSATINVFCLMILWTLTCRALVPQYQQHFTVCFLKKVTWFLPVRSFDIRTYTGHIGTNRLTHM